MIRRICSLAAVVALLLQGSSGGHMLLVEHVQCAEHGALMHGDAEHAHRSSRRTVHVVTAWEPASSESDDAHDHCEHCAERRDAQPSIVKASVAALEREPIIALVSSVEEPCTSIVRFRVAPKNSPPA